MTEVTSYELIKNPIMSRAIRVSTTRKDEWLRLLNERNLITAGPIERFWASEGNDTLVDITYILVSMEVLYDRPRDLQGRLGVPDPHAAIRLIDESIHYVGKRLSR